MRCREERGYWPAAPSPAPSARAQAWARPRRTDPARAAYPSRSSESPIRVAHPSRLSESSFWVAHRGSVAGRRARMQPGRHRRGRPPPGAPRLSLSLSSRLSLSSSLSLGSLSGRHRRGRPPPGAPRLPPLPSLHPHDLSPRNRRCCLLVCKSDMRCSLAGLHPPPPFPHHRSPAGPLSQNPRPSRGCAGLAGAAADSRSLPADAEIPA